MKTLLPSIQLMGIPTIGICYRRPHFDGMAYIGCPEDANALLRKHIDPGQLDLRECFWAVFMTNSNRVLGISEVACGTTLGVQPNPKYIFQLALLTNAVHIIVAHSHPSGSLNISSSDLRETEKLAQVAKLLDMTLLDHLIITSESFVSLSKEGKL